MNRVFYVLLVVILVMSGCKRDGDARGGDELFGRVPEVIKELVREQIALNEEVDRDRLTDNNDIVMYHKARRDDINEKYFAKFKEAVKEIEGNEVRGEIRSGLPYEMIGQPRVADMSGDTLDGTGGFGVKFEVRLKTTCDVKPYYYDEDEGWKLRFHRICVLKGGIVGLMNCGFMDYDFGDIAMNKDSVPVVPEGTEIKFYLDYIFPNSGDKYLLEALSRPIMLYKFVFVSERDFWDTHRIVKFLWQDLPTPEEKAKMKQFNATDKPDTYDIPYVVSTYPKNGAVVDSDLREVRVRFSIPMGTQLRMITGLDNDSVKSIFADRVYTKEEQDKMWYWEDEYTYVMKVTEKLESGKKYGVSVPAGMQSKDDFTKRVRGDLDIVFRVK